MKNSTIVKILLILSVLIPLFWYFTQIIIQFTIILSVAALLVYLILSALDYGNEYAIKKEYNVFIKISHFFRWLDSKPKIIKPSKKKWRSPEDWENEI